MCYKIMIASQNRPYTQGEIFDMSINKSFPCYIPIPNNHSDYFLFSRDDACLIADWIAETFNTEDIVIRREINGFPEYLKINDLKSKQAE